MPVEKLTYMADQIGRHFISQAGTEPEQRIADHLRRFWDPRMRKAIISYVAEGGRGLLPEVLEAVRLLDV